MRARSHKDIAAKAFAKVAKTALPGSHEQLQRALEREARDYQQRVRDLTERPSASAEEDEAEASAERAQDVETVEDEGDVDAEPASQRTTSRSAAPLAGLPRDV